MKISKYFSYGEVLRGNPRYGVTTLTPEIEENARELCANILDPCREFVGGPLGVHSIYRSPAYNSAIGGVSNSQHLLAQAADVDCDIHNIGNNKDLFYYILKKLPFDIMIWEFGTEERPDWIHVSHRLPRYGINRKLARRAIRVDGKAQYINFDL